MFRGFAAALIGLALCACAPADALRVAVDGGIVRGAEANGVRRFLSLPYAAPPLGDLRWRAPQPLIAWTGERDATVFGPSCTQNISANGWGPWTGEFSPQGAVSEDCLTLSVWTPARGANERLPVMLWIHGGGFTDGGEATAVYNGQALAEHGVIVVSMNYRVSGFGMLTHPALEAANSDARGNLPLWDSLAALAWVNANIARFGGDPAQVTIAGQSAGGAIVYALLDAPQARGMIARAIIQSFPPGSHTFATREEAEADAAAFAASLNASTAAALRAAPADDVLRASDQHHMDLYVDGLVVSDRLGAALPLLNDVPILIGVTADESSWLPETATETRARLAENGPAFAALYPAGDDQALREAALLSDRDQALVSLERWGGARAARGGAATYMYLWTHAPPGPDAARYRAFHSSEVPYMFGTLSAAPWRGYTMADERIAERMLGYWSNFVKSGDPNGPGLPDWPADPQTVMQLGDAFAPMVPLNPAVRAYWNARFDSRGEYRF